MTCRLRLHRPEEEYVALLRQEVGPHVDRVYREQGLAALCRAYPYYVAPAWWERGEVRTEKQRGAAPVRLAGAGGAIGNV